LTDNGRELLRRPLRHPYEPYSAVQPIEHRRTQVGSPESNGMVERCTRRLNEEFLSSAYHQKMYDSVEALQADLDAFVLFYNEKRAHHGCRTQGRAPLQTFLDHQLRQEDAAAA
jgi:transposase InsO family protein